MENIICIIENLNDIKIIKKQLDSHPNLKIFTLNYNAHKLLEKNNISHEIGEYHLTPDDKNIINQMATHTTLNWWKNKEIQSILTIDDIIISEFIEMELFQYILTIFKSAKTILRIINDVAPNQILSVTNLNPFVQSVCNGMNIKFQSLSDGEILSLHYDKINIKYNIGPVPLSITTSRKNYKKIKNFTEKLSQKSFRLAPNKKQSQNDTILLLEFNPITYETLIQELGKLEKNIFLLNQRRPAILNKKSLEIIKKSNCKIVDLADFEKNIRSQISSETKSLTENLEKLWQNNSLFEKLFSIESYTLWNSIKPIFSKMCNQRFNESFKRILLLQELFSHFNISEILEWAETGQEEKEVLAVSKKYGIKSIMLQHSMFPIGEIWKPFGRFLALFSHEHQSDYQAIWGNLTHEYAISNNHSKEKLVITGSPKHDSFFSLEKNHNKTGKILLATTGPPAIFAEDSTTDIFLKYDQYIKEVFRVIKKNHPDKELIVKPHPQSDFINNALDLIKETDSNAKIILDTNLPELINNCDLVISFNTSSILLESIILKKPTISLITDEWAKENEIIKMNGVMSINDIQDVEKGISEIISNDDYKLELQSNAKQFLGNYLSNHGTASRQLVEMLEKK
jgi:hypothetical protein